MIAPLILVLTALSGTIAALTLPGQSDYLLLTAPCLIASLCLLLRAILRRKPQNFIIIDGSNVMHWKDGTPQVDVLRDVIQHLTTLGFTPGVIFDANAGHKLAGRYQHDAAMGVRLGLPEDRIIVVPKGTPADPTILAAARDLGARIVTNDRYRDWAEAHPEITTPGHLIRGGYRDGHLWLDMGS
jgi:Zc3h12a-like Ribonuclease NYN domain